MKTKQPKNQPNKGPWTISNAISLFRMLLVIPLIILFNDPYGNQLAILGVCFLGYLTDLGDGYIARLRHEQSDFGRIIDPLADKVVILTIMVAMLVTNLLPFWFIAIVIGRDVLIFFAGIYLKRRTGILVESNYLGKAAVVIIMLVIAVALFQEDLSHSLLQILMILALGMMGASLYMYGERFFRLMRKHPKA